MKKTLLIVLTSFATLAGIAQTTITNGGMENWTGSGTTQEPTQWNSTKSAGGTYSLGISLAPQTCWQETTNPHSGTSCAKVQTKAIIGNVVNGALTTGQIMINSATKAEGFIKTQPTLPDHRMAFTARPDSFVFWYRYTPQGADYPTVQARLHVGNAYAPETPVNNNHPDSSVNIIARALWQGTNTAISGWTRICLPFVYADTRTPQYILVTSTSSGNQTGGVDGSILWLDDFDVIYNPTITTGTVSNLDYYVSAAIGAYISVPYTLTGTFNGANVVSIELSDSSGSFAAPTVIGSIASTTSGVVNGTIPAGTPSGTGYRVRVVSSNPALTASNNGADITVHLVANFISPAGTQNLAASNNGNTITVTENAGVLLREWKYALTPGGPYLSFVPVQGGTTYIPNFAVSGTYYVVCVTTYPNILTVTSNEVMVNVVANSIAPSTSQSILVGVNGTQLTVTETPIGSSREWRYATVSGGPYTTFTPMQMGTTYTPNFAVSGTYYVVCESVINAVTARSNEVLISVGNATLTTGTVSGSPYLFSPSAPDANVSVSYTTSGTFNSGNMFTAQLSDASGSFALPVDIGTVTATGSGSISVTIPHTTAAGTAYRIRVVSSNPVVLGSDNGTDLTVDQFNNSVAPVNTQTIMHGTAGSAINVTASQAATHEWKYSTTSGTGYQSFSPAQTGSSYTPDFAVPGSYYIVAVSSNTYTDAVTSNQVQIDVTNGNTITTSTISGSPFLVSPSMNASVAVDFTSNVVFNSGNIFKAQLSDFAGSFANPVEIGTLTSSNIGTINASIPGNTPGSANYRIRVVSTSPAVTGSDNGTDLQVIPFEISIAPTDTQYIAPGVSGNALAVTTTQAATYQWQYSEVPGSFYGPFSPAQTGSIYAPNFTLAGVYYVVCKATNAANDNLTSSEVVVIVANPNGVNETGSSLIKAYWSGNDFVVDLGNLELSNTMAELVHVNGQIVLKEFLHTSVNRLATSLPRGIYAFRLTNGANTYTGKTVKQ